MASEKEKEIGQKALDLLAQIVDVTGASGREPHNRVIGFKLIDRKGGEDIYGRSLLDGQYVRPIWSDDPERNDGYYDINVNGDSPWGMVYDVLTWARAKF